MSRFNRSRPSRQGGVLATEAYPSGRTFEGGLGYGRDTKSELFLLAVSNFVGQDTFYENAAGRDTRYRDLVCSVTVSDPVWVFDLLRWLRHCANMRTAAIVGGVEAARTLAGCSTETVATSGARRGNLPVTPRRLLDTVLARADEPGEALAYWHAAYGRKLPKWFKRALGDAALRLYTPYTYGKWDSARNAVRFADVIELSQIPRSRADRSGLFRFILDDRPGSSRAPRTADPSGIAMLAARARVMAVPVESRRDVFLHAESYQEATREAGLTWEAISGWLQTAWDAATWARAVNLDLMPYGALLRNLANFEKAGLEPADRRTVVARLINPAAVRRSRLLPMAFLNAYNNVRGDTFKAALDEAATIALANVPSLSGRTLVLIDTSGSMNTPFTTHRGNRRPDAEHLKCWDAAALFGLALSTAATDATVVSFSDTYWGASESGSRLFHLQTGENLLAAVARFRRTHYIGGGTDTAAAVRRWYDRHDRVVVLTDEQARHDGSGVYGSLPARIPVYTFNLEGYRYGHAPSGPNRYLVGGLSDQAFAMIAAIESRKGGYWPWQLAPVT